MGDLGQYVWHCHILSHEKLDMMPSFQVGTVADPAPWNLYTPAVAAPNLVKPVAEAVNQPLFSTTSIAISDDFSASPPVLQLDDTVAGDALADLLA